jgi:hypothetical protein
MATLEVLVTLDVMGMVVTLFWLTWRAAGRRQKRDA